MWDMTLNRAQYSVGSVLHLEVMDDLYRRGNAPVLFDFSTGYGPHKSRFGKEIHTKEVKPIAPTTKHHQVIACLL